MAEILSDLNSDCSREKSSVEGVEGEEEKVVGDTSAGFTKDAWCNYMASWLQVRYCYCCSSLLYPDRTCPLPIQSSVTSYWSIIAVINNT